VVWHTFKPAFRHIAKRASNNTDSLYNNPYDVDSISPATPFTTEQSPGHEICQLQHRLSVCWTTVWSGISEWQRNLTTTGSGSTHLFHRHTSPQHIILFVAPSGSAISRFSRPLRLLVRYATPDIHCRERRHEWDGGIILLTIICDTSRPGRRTNVGLLVYYSWHFY